MYILIVLHFWPILHFVLRHRFAPMEVLLPPRFRFAAHLIHQLGLLNLVFHKLGVFGGTKMPVKKMYQLGAWQPPSTPRLYWYKKIHRLRY